MKHESEDARLTDAALAELGKSRFVIARSYATPAGIWSRVFNVVAPAP